MRFMPYLGYTHRTFDPAVLTHACIKMRSFCESRVLIRAYEERERAHASDRADNYAGTEKPHHQPSSV